MSPASPSRPLAVPDRPARLRGAARTFAGVATLLVLAAVAGRAAAQEASDRVDPRLLAGLEARSLGPATMGGRIAALAVTPGRPQQVWVGAATGGLWRSDDGALTWEPIFDDQPVAAIGAVALSAANPDRVWVGTGEGNPRNSASVGNGVYRSDDGGSTWTYLGLAESERIHRVVPHPTDPDTAWVCAMGPTWGDGGERGVYKTTDAGSTWRPVLRGGNATTGCADLVADPRNPLKLVAALWDHRRWPWFFRSGGAGSGLFVSRDGGESWEEATAADGLPSGPLGRIGLAIAPSDPQVVYAYVEAEENGLYRSTDGGRSWELRTAEPTAGNRPFYYADLRVDPRSPGRVYSLWSMVSLSEDGGGTFRVLVPFATAHPDHHAMWIDPADPERILLGNDGGVYESRDHGESWRFVSNLPLAQYYHVRVDDRVPYNVYGGLQDNGSWVGPSEVRENGGIRNHHWQEVAFGDGFDTVPIRGDEERGYAMSQEGNLVRWDLATGERKMIRPAPPAAPEGEEAAELRFNWNAAIAPDPFDPDTVYFGSQYVHRSRDRGETWEVISPDLTTDRPEWQQQAKSGGLTPDVTGAENFTSLVALAPSPVEPGVIWAGSDDGRLHVTRDGGATWTSVEGNVRGVPAHTWIPHVEASPHDAATAFVVFDNHRRSDWTPYVFRTTDYGATWQGLVHGGGDRRLGATGGEEGDAERGGRGRRDSGVRGYALAIVQDPVDPDLLFLGTEFGLWASLDGGASWLPWRHGVPTVSVMDLAIQPRESDLVVATHGRSLFVVDDVSPLRDLDPAVLAKPLHLFPVPDAQQYRVAQTGSSRFPGSGEFRGENEPYGALLTFSLAGDALPWPDDEAEETRRGEELAALREEGARSLPGFELAEEAGKAAESGEAETGGAAEDEPDEDSAATPRKPGEEGPKAELEIRDASGTVIRTFERKVHRGVNRVAWDLTRDAFAEPDPGDLPRWREPSGPEVLPGDYTVTVRFGGEEASAPVRVVADPRFELSSESRQAKMDALMRNGALQEALTAAIDRLGRTRKDVETVLARRQKAGEERRGAAAEDDATPGLEPEGEAGVASSSAAAGITAAPTGEAANDPVSSRARALLEALDEQVRRLWTPPSTKGILAETTPWDHVGRASWMLGGDWAAPTPAQLAYLERAERSTREALEAVNRFYAEEVAPLRAAAEADLRLLPEEEPLAIP